MVSSSTHLPTYIRLFVYMYTYLLIYVCVYVYLFTHLYTFVCMYVYLPTYKCLFGCMCTYLPIYVCLDVCVCVSRYVSKLRLLSSVTLQKNHFYELKYSNVLERVILKPSTYLLDGQNNMAKTIWPKQYGQNTIVGHRYDFVEICVRWHKINFMYVHCLQTAIAMVSFALFV